MQREKNENKQKEAGFGPKIKKMMMLGLFDFLLFAFCCLDYFDCFCDLPFSSYRRVQNKGGCADWANNVTAAARSTTTSFIGKILCFYLQGLSQSYIMLFEKALLYFISKALLYFISKAILYYENMANL